MEDYKQKYEEALDNFKKIKAANKDNKELVDFIEYEYPELKERENSRIKTNIIKLLRFARDTHHQYSDECNEAIDWLEKQTDANKEYWRGYREGKQEIIDKYSELEKQGEQKPIDKVEQEEDVELTDFESALFSAFSDAWQEYLRGEEVNVAKWAKEHSAELLEVVREQKPAWSEEDERYYDSALWHIKNSCGNEGNVYNWLKSIKERIKGE